MLRKLLALSLTLVLAALIAGQASARTKKTVKLGDDYFVRAGSPPTVTVSKGTKVTFRWKGKSLHDVHARSGPVTFKSSNKHSGSYSKVLSKRGTYVIYCDVHAPDMRMTIKVK
jgi:plastocyanin